MAEDSIEAVRSWFREQREPERARSAHTSSRLPARAARRALFFAFEESQDQIIRNMRSVGIELERFVKKGLLKFHNARPSAFGLEVHLALIHKAIS